MRGGVTKIFGGPGATGVLTGHRKWSDEGAQNANGIYKLGKLGDIDVFRTPTDVCPNDELTCVYKNEALPEDVFIMIGTLVPLHVTDKIQLANRQTQFGVASYGDIQINQKAGTEVEQLCGPYGKDDIEFMISANPGNPPLPLAKIASGGELSRVMLALKTIFARTDGVETLIFDEIVKQCLENYDCKRYLFVVPGSYESKNCVEVLSNKNHLNSKSCEKVLLFEKPFNKKKEL